MAVDADGGHRRVLVDGPGTDESGPVWSHDGRWLFATSVLRSVKDGAPLMSSVVYVDLWGSSPILRMLYDRSAPVARSGPALAPVALDSQILVGGAPYRETLHAIMLHRLLTGPGAASTSPDATTRDR